MKIADFGIATAAPDLGLPSGFGAEDLKAFTRAMANGSARQPKGIRGTIDYISPEQFRTGRIDQRADIYSLGVVAYELLTGRVPFADLEYPGILLAKANGDVPPPDGLRPDCPAELSRVVMKAMDPHPEDRYQSAREMLEDLWEVERAVGRREAASAERAVRASRPYTILGELWKLGVAAAFVTLACLFVIAMLRPGEPARVMSKIQAGLGGYRLPR